MASYVELIRQDVCCHSSSDASSWPSVISELVQSMQNELKIPSWLKGSVPYTSERVIDLLDRLRASDDASNVGMWDDADEITDRDVNERLHVVFNTALVDCARVRAVVEAESLTTTRLPKESFLVVLVRNIMMNAHPRLSSLEEVPVVLPRHFSGEAVQILKYMVKSFYAPLIVSIPQEIPVKENSPGLDPSDQGEDSSVESELFKHSPPTLSEWLDACEKPKTVEEVEEPEGGVLPPQFDVYFLAFSPSATPSSICHIPILCMADEEQLPVCMSSLLYQRRQWHISDPLIGLEFSKYDTTIRLFLGWLEDDLPSGRVLPRVHLGVVGTPIKLDLSSPSGVIAISRLLYSMESYVSAVHDSVRHSVGAVISDTQSQSPLAWRIDTDIRNDDSALLLENNNGRDMITRWIKSQKDSKVEGTMPPRKQTSTGSRGSATSVPPPQQSTSAQSSYQASPSLVSSVPKLREPRSDADSVPTFCSQLSCSAFAATSEKDESRVFRWMFDRRVAPQCIPSDPEFREEYNEMTCFIWPEMWHVREDLPPVDAALEPCVRELLDGVAALKTRPGAVKCVPVKEFPVDLRILEQSFSAIFQASRRSREKTQLQETVYEAAWRHDHDRLLYDFFIRLVQPYEGDAAHLPMNNLSIAYLEDPLSRPTLETTLRFPKSDNLQTNGREELHVLIEELLHRRPTDLRSWLHSRGGSTAAYLQEAEHASYVVSRWAFWRQETNAETASRMISKLGQFPSTGKCDALGRLLVKLPKVSPKDVGSFPLVVRAAEKHNRGRGDQSKAPATGSRAQADWSREQSERSAKMSNKSLTIPDGSSGAATTADGTRYTILSSALHSPIQSLHEEQLSLAESVDALASKVHHLQLGPDTTCLELPILAVEYKKSSDNFMKGTNQLRMYLATSVKFLQAVGITSFPVYGVQTDGPIVVLPAAILRDDNFVYLFERLVERLDISTPLGAWHYATILCRLAENHAKALEKKFEEVKDDLVTSLLRKENEMEGWTLDHQMARLKAENKAKSPPPRETKAKE